MMDQPLNHHVLQDLLTETMDYRANDKIVQTLVLSGKESLTAYCALTKRICEVKIRRFSQTDDYKLFVSQKS